ncbi:MAG: hypothetical protein C4575_13015 [Desulforudis sp.]|jgi:hypothetical protein|nr:MAG: hypothetical protein C4575_13015 [Desulforudis sp.]
MQPKEPPDQPIEPQAPLPQLDIKPVQIPPAPHAISLRVRENGKVVSLIIDDGAYSFDPDTALGIANALRNAANKIKALQFAGRKGKRK